jgi:hypothetical protein
MIENTSDLNAASLNHQHTFHLKNLFLVFIIILVYIAGLMTMSFVQARKTTISVKGTGSTKIPADSATITIYTSPDDHLPATSCLGNCNPLLSPQPVKAIDYMSFKNDLIKLGVSTKDIQIKSSEQLMTIDLEKEKLALLSMIITTAAKYNITITEPDYQSYSPDITYNVSLSAVTKYKDKAREDAIAKAKQQAENIATENHQRLGKILSIKDASDPSLDVTNYAIDGKIPTTTGKTYDLYSTYEVTYESQ